MKFKMEENIEVLLHFLPILRSLEKFLPFAQGKIILLKSAYMVPAVCHPPYRDDAQVPKGHAIPGIGCQSLHGVLPGPQEVARPQVAERRGRAEAGARAGGAEGRG